MSRVSAKLREIVAKRSHHRCAYCLTDEQISGVLFTIDHIIPQALGGQTVAENLCLACWDCNLIKNKRIADIDPETGQMTSLFHRYKHLWQEHFAWQDKGLLVIGLTPTGRATVNLLKLNRPALVHAREWWIKVGWHPPE